MLGESATSIVVELGGRLASRGLDLVHPFRLDRVQRGASAEELLPWGGRPDALGLLVGNTRAVWPHFVDALARAPDGQADPFDRWVESVVESCIEGTGVREVLFAHEPPPRRRSFQRIATAAGLAPLPPGRLLAHPRFGPWFALRVVLLFDRPGPSDPPPGAVEPCGGCAAPCRDAFARAREEAGERRDRGVVHRNWQMWLAVRDACPVGVEHRYSNEQILFHYAGRDPRPRGTD